MNNQQFSRHPLFTINVQQKMVCVRTHTLMYIK